MQMIDLALAFALIYAMTAGLVSGVQELLASFVQLRGKYLRDGIASLLHESEHGGDTTLTALYDHPTFKALADTRTSIFSHRLPSYVAAHDFAVALADTLVKRYGANGSLFEGLPEAVQRMPVDSPLRQQLSLLIALSGDQAQALKAALEAHYDAVMERVSGWYKRRTQVVAFVIALGVAFAFNIDSIAIAAYLRANPAELDRLASQAMSTVSKSPSTAPADANKYKEQVDALLKAHDSFAQLKLPIGWEAIPHWRCLISTLAPLGWLITALAAMLGAPFWYDLISRFAPLRGAGSRPPASTTGATAVAATTTASTVATAPSVAAPDDRDSYERSALNELDIAALQEALGLVPDTVSARIDEATRAALRRWQLEHQRPPSGHFDADTARIILYGA